ncbi:GGDEF domain-containing protein [Polynucleobacter sp. MWH-Braz-FAM2G]|uniref:GGDEF domain-containing protein n=1 Tax=Polynucleobacter sp. MWH-Braz-FAM2G TaxID=1855883 RepID=UPI001BFD7FDC|nr:GGDEF domain-containing protein [Polynucleobacter sp. MWH-Braz-FAM2G]QWD89958.1 GGDEF domain-containing protein [Polynucleobacter sp. MWH-Braz-FAM2G]
MRIDRRQSIANSALTKAVYTISGVVLLIMLISSVWTYYSINQILTISLERRDIALSKGVGIAVSDSIIRRDYSEMESKLRQVMLNQNILSILVADPSGTPLMYLKRPDINSEPAIIFDQTAIQTPIPSQEASQIITENDIPYVWSPITAGVRIGWVRMSISTNISDRILNTLRRNIVLSVVGLFLAVISILIYTIRHFFKGIEQHEIELIQTNKTLEEVAQIDALTGLPNRLSLNQRILAAMNDCVEEGGILAVCFLDLDGFKEVNDTLGHHTGDLLLIEVAKRLRAMVREQDSVIRLGGDEFVLLLGAQVTPDKSKVSLKRIIKALSKVYLLNGNRVEISASLGVTFYPFDNGTPEQLLEHADQAMYAAKRNGKNQWYFYQSTQKDLFEEVAPTERD